VTGEVRLIGSREEQAKERFENQTSTGERKSETRLAQEKGGE
jgi:hypothetical protein